MRIRDGPSSVQSVSGGCAGTLALLEIAASRFGGRCGQMGGAVVYRQMASHWLAQVTMTSSDCVAMTAESASLSG